MQRSWWGRPRPGKRGSCARRAPANKNDKAKRKERQDFDGPPPHPAASSPPSSPSSSRSWRDGNKAQTKESKGRQRAGAKQAHAGGEFWPAGLACPPPVGIHVKGAGTRKFDAKAHWNQKPGSATCLGPRGLHAGDSPRTGWARGLRSSGRWPVLVAGPLLARARRSVPGFAQGRDKVVARGGRSGRPWIARRPGRFC